MALAQTQAASYIQAQTEEISSHKIISLLMEGAIERAEQSVQALRENRNEDLEPLVQKFIAIVNGLKNSLDMQAGGEIAQNLDALYSYIIERVSLCMNNGLEVALVESRNLIEEIKLGWDSMDFSGLEPVEL